MQDEEEGLQGEPCGLQDAEEQHAAVLASDALHEMCLVSLQRLLSSDSCAFHDQELEEEASLSGLVNNRGFMHEVIVEDDLCDESDQGERECAHWREDIGLNSSCALASLFSPLLCPSVSSIPPTFYALTHLQHSLTLSLHCIFLSKF